MRNKQTFSTGAHHAIWIRGHERAISLFPGSAVQREAYADTFLYLITGYCLMNAIEPSMDDMSRYGMPGEMSAKHAYGVAERLVKLPPL